MVPLETGNPFICIDSPPHKALRLLQKEWKIQRLGEDQSEAVGFGHDRTTPLINFQQLWLLTQDQTSRLPRVERGAVHGSPLPAEELLIVDDISGKET